MTILVWGLRPMNTRGACRVTVDPEAEGGIAHVVFHVARPSGGATYMKRILHLVSVKNITFKSSYNWFKIDIHQQLRPLTANYGKYHIKFPF